MDSSRSSGVWSIAEKYTELRRISFQCGCGNCTALGFIKGKDRCRSKKLPQVKVWTPETLSPVDRITKTELPYSIFEEALKDETRKVFDSFCSLLHATFKMLQKNATFDDVKGFVSSLLARHTYYGEIYSEVESQHFGLIRNFSDLREYLEINCCSWFNYKIIVALRKQFRRNRPLKKDDKLATYKDLFNQYVNRRSFLFLDDLGPELPQESSVNVICKIDVDFTTITPQQIAHLKKVLIECIQQISEYSLTLKNVKDGCTELTFRAPAYLRGIKELTPTQVNQLQQNRFLLLKIDNKIFLSVSLSFGHADRIKALAYTVLSQNSNRFIIMILVYTFRLRHRVKKHMVRNIVCIILEYFVLAVGLYKYVCLFTIDHNTNLKLPPLHI